MRVYVYETLGEPQSPGSRFLARIWCEFSTKGGKVKHDWHPVVVFGASHQEAHQKAQAWWDAETERAAQKVANVAAGVAKRQAARAIQSQAQENRKDVS